MLWMILILLFILDANNITIPLVAWWIAWIYAAITVLDIIIKALDKKDKNN